MTLHNFSADTRAEKQEGNRRAPSAAGALPVIGTVHEVALSVVIQRMTEAGDGEYTGGLREALAVLRALAEGTHVLVPKGVMRQLRCLANAVAQIESIDRKLKLTGAATPEEKP